jgi:hypothetical protein
MVWQQYGFKTGENLSAKEPLQCRTWRSAELHQVPTLSELGRLKSERIKVLVEGSTSEQIEKANSAWSLQRSFFTVSSFGQGFQSNHSVLQNF